MTISGMIEFTINCRPVNGEDFKEYLLNLRTICTNKRIENPTFIMDNARIHHYTSLKDIVEELGINILYLPPYSPFLNPIENVFSKWKNYIASSNALNEEQLMNSIDI